MSDSPTPQKTPEIGNRLEAHGGLLAAEVLVRHGVDTLFTLSGGHIFPLYDGCLKKDIRLIDVRHEQSAVFAAEGWAKVTRKPGAAALTAGPGVTNGISAITSAWFTGSPIFVLGGRAPAARWGQGSLQELDHVPIVQSVTRFAETSKSTAAVPSDVHRALLASTTAQRGPSFLDVPMDAFFGSAEAELPAAPTDLELRTPDASPDDLAAIGALLARSQRPVLMAGGDVYWEHGEHELRALAEETRTPVFMNGLGRGLLAADHELAFSRCRSVAFKGADLVIVVGTPLDFRLGFGSFGDAQVVHVMDTRERLAGHASLAASAAGNLCQALSGIRQAALETEKPQHDAWVATLQAAEQERRSKETELLASNADPIHPVRVYGELTRRLDRNAIVIGDGGDFVSYAGKYIDSYEPGCFLDPGPYGCLGTGPGYALGASLAHPGRQVVLMLGDGAAGFSIGDFDTLARFQLPVVAVMGNNLCWGLEKHPMKKLYGYHVAAELSPEVRYDDVVSALGGAGRRVEKPSEIGKALDWALAQRGPTLLDIRTDPENEYPRSSVLG